MTTLAELVAATPAATRGVPTQIVHGTGVWRFVVELADPSAGTSVVWYDITDDVAGYRLDRGADQYAGRYRAAVATLELVADDDRYAPWNEDTSPTFGTHIDLGAGLLIRAGFVRVVDGSVADWLPRFTNRVESWSDASYARGRARRHLIVTRDLLTGLVNVPYGFQGSTNWYTRANNLLTAAGWDFGSTIYGAQTTTGPTDVLTMPDRDEGSSAIGELDATFDPAGIVWRTDRTGKLIAHPQPGDTFHADKFTAGATGTAYTWPSAITWSYLADDDPAMIGYAADSDLEPFGIDSTEAGLVNRLVVSDSGTYDIDDATSIGRHGYRPRSVSWIADSDQVADDILARLAFATKQARPITTTVDLAGFMPNAPALDHLSPVVIQHTTGDDRDDVTATGYVRTLIEQVAPRGPDGIDWSITMTADIDATDHTAKLNPVTGLAAGSITDQYVELSWTNPSQTITPTGTQIRVESSIWLTVDYPVTAFGWLGLTPSTSYEAQVRLIREVDGIITNVSPIRRVEFTTAAPTRPFVADDGTAGTVRLPPAGTGTNVEWVLEETDDVPGAGWSTVDSGTAVSLAEVALDPAAFATDHIYRIKARDETGPGAWSYSDEFVHECTAEDVLALTPYLTAALYVPGWCPANVPAGRTGGRRGFHGPAFGGLWMSADTGDSVAAVADDDGIVAYGSSPTLEGLTGDLTVAVSVDLDDFDAVAAYVKAFQVGPATLWLQPATGGMTCLASVRTAAGVLTRTSATITGPGECRLAVTYNSATGVVSLYVDGVLDGTVGSTPGELLPSPAIWMLGAPSGGRVYDAGVWSSVGVELGEPVELFADTFDRADSSSLGAAWSDASSWSIASNQAALTGVGGLHAERCLTDMGGPNHYAQGYISGSAVNPWFSALAVRMAASNTCYFGYYDDQANVWVIAKYNGTASTTLTTSAGTRTSTLHRLTVDGTAITLYESDGAGGWTQRATVTDTTYSTGNFTGFIGYRLTGTMTVDDFSAGSSYLT